MSSICKEESSINELNNTEFEISHLARELLRKHGYVPKQLFFENGNISPNYNFKDYGIDDIVYVEGLPIEDIFNFKNNKPFNLDGVYYSIDYRSNNFSNYNETNDNFIFVKLSEVVRNKYLNEEYLRRLEKESLRMEESGKIKIKGILSEYNSDYHFYIKYNGNGYRDNLRNGVLINAYFVPVNTLKDQVVTNLNQIREEHGLEPLNFNDIVSLILDIHETFGLYKLDLHKLDVNYNFELLIINDNHGKPDLMMKIRKDYLQNYIKFDLNGEIE
ncbi:MAG: hypothetical protein K8E24_006470 [Methanobacterium paludis]|nr:hypothetical protein [Methanobacterium paludis]